MVLFFDPKKINLIEIHDRQVSRASKNRVTPSKGRYQKIYIMQNYTIVRASSLNFGKHKISTVYPYSPSFNLFNSSMSHFWWVFDDFASKLRGFCCGSMAWKQPSPQTWGYGCIEPWWHMTLWLWQMWCNGCIIRLDVLMSGLRRMFGTILSWRPWTYLIPTRRPGGKSVGISDLVGIWEMDRVQRSTEFILSRVTLWI